MWQRRERDPATPYLSGTMCVDRSSPWTWKGVPASLSSGRYTLSYPMWRGVDNDEDNVWCFHAFANLVDKVWHSSDGHYPADTKYLYNICTIFAQRRRRWADVVQMLYKCLCLPSMKRIINEPLIVKRITTQCDKRLNQTKCVLYITFIKK